MQKYTSGKKIMEMISALNDEATSFINKTKESLDPMLRIQGIDTPIDNVSGISTSINKLKTVDPCITPKEALNLIDTPAPVFTGHDVSNIILYQDSAMDPDYHIIFIHAGILYDVIYNKHANTINRKMKSLPLIRSMAEKGINFRICKVKTEHNTDCYSAISYWIIPSSGSSIYLVTDNPVDIFSHFKIQSIELPQMCNILDFAESDHQIALLTDKFDYLYIDNWQFEVAVVSSDWISRSTTWILGSEASNIVSFEITVICADDPTIVGSTKGEIYKFNSTTNTFEYVIDELGEVNYDKHFDNWYDEQQKEKLFGSNYGRVTDIRLLGGKMIGVTEKRLFEYTLNSTESVFTILQTYDVSSAHILIQDNANRLYYVYTHGFGKSFKFNMYMVKDSEISVLVMNTDRENHHLNLIENILVELHWLANDANFVMGIYQIDVENEYIQHISSSLPSFIPTDILNIQDEIIVIDKRYNLLNLVVCKDGIWRVLNISNTQDILVSTLVSNGKVCIGVIANLSDSGTQYHRIQYHLVIIDGFFNSEHKIKYRSLDSAYPYSDIAFEFSMNNSWNNIFYFTDHSCSKIIGVGIINGRPKYYDIEFDFDFQIDRVISFMSLYGDIVITYVGEDGVQRSAILFVKMCPSGISLLAVNVLCGYISDIYTIHDTVYMMYVTDAKIMALTFDSRYYYNNMRCDDISDRISIMIPIVTLDRNEFETPNYKIRYYFDTVFICTPDVYEGEESYMQVGNPRILLTTCSDMVLHKNHIHKIFDCNNMSRGLNYIMSSSDVSLMVRPEDLCSDITPSIIEPVIETVQEHTNSITAYETLTGEIITNDDKAYNAIYYDGDKFLRLYKDKGYIGHMINDRIDWERMRDYTLEGTPMKIVSYDVDNEKYYFILTMCAKVSKIYKAFIDETKFISNEMNLSLDGNISDIVAGEFGIEHNDSINISHMLFIKLLTSDKKHKIYYANYDHSIKNTRIQELEYPENVDIISQMKKINLSKTTDDLVKNYTSIAFVCRMKSGGTGIYMVSSSDEGNLMLSELFSVDDDIVDISEFDYRYNANYSEFMNYYGVSSVALDGKTLFTMRDGNNTDIVKALSSSGQCRVYTFDVRWAIINVFIVDGETSDDVYVIENRRNASTKNLTRRLYCVSTNSSDHTKISEVVCDGKYLIMTALYGQYNDIMVKLMPNHPVISEGSFFVKADEIITVYTSFTPDHVFLTNASSPIKTSKFLVGEIHKNQSNLIQSYTLYDNGHDRIEKISDVESNIVNNGFIFKNRTGNNRLINFTAIKENYLD